MESDPVELIDGLIDDCSGRELVLSGDVVDALLDIRQAVLAGEET